MLVNLPTSFAVARAVDATAWANASKESFLGKTSRSVSSAYNVNS